MITNNSLKEYYVKIQELYDNALNLLTGINQSLLTNASEITVPILKDNYIEQEIRIPSFVYLENKLEELSTNFSNLFNIPNSGDAWITNNTGQYKLQMVKANTAPIAPVFSTNNIFASITDNNFLKDLVSPKTFLKINIDNLPLGIESMMMKKVIVHNASLFESLKNRNITSYEELYASLFNYSKGTDYDEYDSELNMPCRKDKYNSLFTIIDIPSNDKYETNPWIDSSTSKLNYKLVLNTFTYYDKDNSAITFDLKIGDYLVLGNGTNIYKIKNIDTSDMSVILEEYVGHTTLQTTSENQNMVFQIYNNNYVEFDYIEVPLEENQFIIIFLACIYNNVQSQWSKPSFFDMSSILIKDQGGNYILDNYGNKLSYLDYYNKYCTNIGDLILGLTQTAFPQISNFSSNILETLQNGNEVKELVNASWDSDVTLQVVPINKHLTDDVTSDEIMNLHAQKNELNAQIQTNQANIDNTYNKLTTIDFSTQISITQIGLQEELNKYYTERTNLQKQLAAVINSINSKSLDVKINGEDVKYRVRGITNTEYLTTWLHNTVGELAEFISMDVEYKYKSPSKDTNSLTSINHSIFTDWIKQPNVDKERKLVFSKNGTKGYGIEWENYSSTTNIIKWNQIDIPINSGEDVIIRIRYKYNIGQPFITLYTPWSNELTVSFPSQYQENIELTSILDQNKEDTTVAAFNGVLINEGYSEHIQNKLITNEQKFFHMPENIYSGFNTPENNLISLKDKLLSMNNEIEKWKTLLDNESNAKFEVYLSYDDLNIQLTPNTKNKINIYNSDHISNSFIKKEMNIVIKNTGEVRLNLYSIFPGNVNIPLIMDNSDYYRDKISNYDRVPIYINNELSGQYLGQWIYFRETNPWTYQKIYYETEQQNNSDYLAVNDFNTNDKYFSLNYIINPVDIMKSSNKQSLLGYRNRSIENVDSSLTIGKWSTLSFENGKLKYNSINTETNQSIENQYNRIGDYFENWYIYPFTTNNMFITKFEDICGIYRNGEEEPMKVYLDENTNILSFIDAFEISNFDDISLYEGAFLYPNIISKELIMTTGAEKDSVFIEVGESLTIPIVFEYFCNNLTEISKSLYFDLRNSLVADPKHFMIEVIGHNDYTASNDMYINYSNNIGNDDATMAD